MNVYLTGASENSSFSFLSFSFPSVSPFSPLLFFMSSFLLLSFSPSLTVLKFIHFFKNKYSLSTCCEYFCFLSGSVAILWVSSTLGLDMWVSNHEVSSFSLINYHFIYLNGENINLIIKDKFETNVWIICCNK